MDNELTRKTAHVLLDMLSTQQLEGDDQMKESAAQTAFARLNEIGAVALLVDDETDERSLDISPVLYGASTLTWSLMKLLEQDGHPIDDQIVALRSQVDLLFGGNESP